VHPQLFFHRDDKLLHGMIYIRPATLLLSRAAYSHIGMFQPRLHLAMYGMLIKQQVCPGNMPGAREKYTITTLVQVYCIQA
jgi:hypothetical protein